MGVKWRIVDGLRNDEVRRVRVSLGGFVVERVEAEAAMKVWEFGE